MTYYLEVNRGHGWNLVGQHESREGAQIIAADYHSRGERVRITTDGNSIVYDSDEARLAHLLAYGVPLGSDGTIKAGGILDGKTPAEVMQDRDDYRRIVGE